MIFLRRAIILYSIPRRAVFVLLCLALLCGMVVAQQRRKQKTPRAIALVEWPVKGDPIIIPVAILIDGRYYDASIYKADPVPMALEGGTVYEVEQSGDPLGFATVDMVRDVNGSWQGLAKYQTKAALDAATQRKSVPAVLQERDEGPPRLHKGGKPAEKQPTTEPPAETKPEPSPKSSDDDGRPRLHKPSEQPPPAAPTAPPVEEAKPQLPPQPETDPDAAARPRLRRGKPVEALQSAPAPAAARTTTTSTVAHGKAGPAPVKVLPAVSDATVTEARSFLMPGSESASPRMRAGMENLARTALEKYSAAHGSARIGALENVEVRAFDLTLTNQATVVLTASAHVAPPQAAPIRRSTHKTEPAPAPPATDDDLTFWVTIVARENYDGEMRQLQSWCTDSKHLDAYSRIELIDAIDADGDGRGELLFRAVNDLGRSFLITRVTADQVLTLYDSGELQR